MLVGLRQTMPGFVACRRAYADGIGGAWLQKLRFLKIERILHPLQFAGHGRLYGKSTHGGSLFHRLAKMHQDVGIHRYAAGLFCRFNRQNRRWDEVLMAIEFEITERDQ